MINLIHKIAFFLQFGDTDAKRGGRRKKVFSDGGRRPSGEDGERGPSCISYQFWTGKTYIYIVQQCLSQDLETGCLKLAVVKFLGVQISEGDYNILIFQP